MKKENKIVRILMDRDGLSKEEANERLDEVREMIADAHPCEVEDILAFELGLEMDYIFDILM
jgi:tetrahydromethanopterin S-methyltransferase subunit G